MESQEKPLLEFEDELRYITFGLFGCSFERYKHCVLKNGFLLFHLEKVFLFFFFLNFSKKKKTRDKNQKLKLK